MEEEEQVSDLAHDMSEAVEDFAIEDMEILREALEDLANWCDVEEEVDWCAHYLGEERKVNSFAHFLGLDCDEDVDQVVDEHSNECVLEHDHCVCIVLLLLVFLRSGAPVSALVVLNSAKPVVEAHGDKHHDVGSDSPGAFEYLHVCVFAHSDVFFFFVLEESSSILDVFGIFGIVLLALENLEFLVELFIGEDRKLSKVEVNLDLLCLDCWAVHVEIKFIRFLLLLSLSSILGNILSFLLV